VVITYNGVGRIGSGDGQMPSWAEVLKVLGFSTPFVYAAAAYGLFHWLDKKASGQAKRAISGWFKYPNYDQLAVAGAIVEVFDRIYTFPLFALRAFVRSALITLLVTVAYIVQTGFAGALAFFVFDPWSRMIVLGGLLANVLSDFISLFLIRRWLRLGSSRPLLAIITGPLVGGAVILALYSALCLAAVYWTQVDVIGWQLRLPSAVLVFPTAIVLLPVLVLCVPPALLVHLWLLLFGAGVIVCKLVNAIRSLAARMQWFLKQGQHHPFQAVGLVASAIVFVSGALIQYVWR
jgi:hypothetical protein